MLTAPFLFRSRTVRHAGYNALPHSPGQLARCLTAGAQALPGSFERGSILYGLSQCLRENDWNPVLVDTECLSECASASDKYVGNVFEQLQLACEGQDVRSSCCGEPGRVLQLFSKHAGYNALPHSPGQLARCLTAGAQALPGSFERGSILYGLSQCLRENDWNPVLVDTECLSECASASDKYVGNVFEQLQLACEGQDVRSSCCGEPRRVLQLFSDMPDTTLFLTRRGNSPVALRQGLRHSPAPSKEVLSSILSAS